MSTCFFMKNFKRFCFAIRISLQLAIISFCFLFSCFCNAQNGSVVSGTIKGFTLQEKTDLTINRYNGYSFTVYETVLPNDEGKFKFDKELAEGFYQLTIPSQGIVCPFYSTGKNNVELSVVNTNYQIDKVEFIDVENKALTELLAASKRLEISLNTLSEKFDPRQLDSFYLKKIKPYNIEVQQAYREFNRKIEKLKIKYPETVVMNIFSSIYQLPLFDEDKRNNSFYDNQDAYMRDHFFDLWKSDDSRVVHLPEVKIKLEKYFRFFATKNHKFLTEKCDDIISYTKSVEVKLYLASLLIDFFTQVKENDVVAYIVENNLNGCLDGIDLDLINFNQNNLRGTKVSKLELPSESLQPVTLSTVYSKSKITVLYFWTPDCIHCRNLHPLVKSAKVKYGNNLAVFSVCMEDDEKKWKDVLSEFSLNFNNVIDSGEQRKQVKKLFYIKYTPMIYILNESGEILDKDLSSEDLEKSLNKFLK